MGHESFKTEETSAASEPPEKMVHKHDASEAQVFLRWGLQQGFVVPPKNIKPGRIS